MIHRPTVRLAGFVLAAGFSAVAASADVLHLAGGGVVEADAWWIEDDVLVYSNADGTVGLPRSIVVRIEHTDGTSTKPRDENVVDSRSNADSTAAPAAAAPRRVPRAIAEQLRAANDALKRRDFDTAASLYLALMDDTEADFPEPRVGYALTQVAMGEDDLALAVVLDSLSHDPNQPAMLELLGDLYDRRERVPDALSSWKNAFAVAPNDRLHDKIQKAERELAAGRDYELSMSSHFNVRFDGAEDDELGTAVVEFLEEQYWDMADVFDHAPRQPITVLLYPSRQFRDVTQAPEWVGGLYDGKIRVPIGGLNRLDPRARALLRHELTHAFVHSKSRGQSPRWLHEGLAQRLEGRQLSRADRQKIVLRLGQGDPADWELKGFSYPAALSLTMHLEQWRGLDGLVRVLRLLGAGEEADRAWREVFGFGYADLCRDWGTAVLAEGTR